MYATYNILHHRELINCFFPDFKNIVFGCTFMLVSSVLDRTLESKWPKTRWKNSLFLAEPKKKKSANSTSLFSSELFSLIFRVVVLAHLRYFNQTWLCIFTYFTSLAVRFLVLRICKQDGVRQVCVEHVNHNPDSEAAFEELLELLTPECIRYVLFKAKFTTEDGRETEQMANFMWRGSKTKVASKMRYAGTFNTVKTSISTKMQHEYDSKAELTFEDICKRMM